MTISRDYLNAIKEALRRTLGADCICNVYDKDTLGTDAPIEWEVGWASVGAVSVEEAWKAASDLNKACRMAERLNGMEYVVDYSKASEIRTKEEWLATVTFLAWTLAAAL